MAERMGVDRGHVGGSGTQNGWLDQSSPGAPLKRLRMSTLEKVSQRLYLVLLAAILGLTFFVGDYYLVLGIGALVFAPLFLVLGVLFCFVAIRDARRAKASEGWLPTQGTVSSSQVESYFVHRSRTYLPRVSYEYSVGGVGYEGTNLRGQELSSRESKAREVVARYPRGASVTVHYDPKDPREAVLEKGASQGRFILALVTGTIFVLLGVLMFPYFGMWLLGYAGGLG